MRGLCVGKFSAAFEIYWFLLHKRLRLTTLHHLSLSCLMACFWRNFDTSFFSPTSSWKTDLFYTHMLCRHFFTHWNRKCVFPIFPFFSRDTRVTEGNFCREMFFLFTVCGGILIFFTSSAWLLKKGLRWEEKNVALKDILIWLKKDERAEDFFYIEFFLIS